MREGARTSWGGGGGKSGWLEERKVVPSGCTVQPAARARAARTSFMSARAGSGKLPCCRSPASMRLVMARRCRSRSFVRSFSRSRSRSPRLRGEPPAVEANPRGRRCGGGDGDGSPSRCGGCFMALGRFHPPAPAPICGRERRARGPACPQPRAAALRRGVGSFQLQFDRDRSGSILPRGRSITAVNNRSNGATRI